jgi:23S rRNA (adenine1618-N6)-methyltransferase
MIPDKREHPEVKTGLHIRNKHRERYDFKKLITSCPELGAFVKPNKFQDKSIDFFNPVAVRTLNKALLFHFYNLKFWEFPADYLCPPIPGRADYIHHLADLFFESKPQLITHKSINGKIKCLDIGVGANCIYPIIGVAEYNWSFIATDIDELALKSAKEIVAKNDFLKDKVEFRLQSNSSNFFSGVINKEELIDFTICNPPFHSSEAEATINSTRKVSNLKQKRVAKPVLNFGGHSHELWCEGGEAKFVENMIIESVHFGKSCCWFTTLISKYSNLKGVYLSLKKAGAVDIKTLPMNMGNKTSRIVAWTFLNPEQQKAWMNRLG